MRVVRILNNKAYRFRLYPNKEQEVLINKTFGCTRFIYNKLLTERIALYEEFENNITALKLIKPSTPATYKVGFPWLKEVDSLALCNAQLNLKSAYKNFFSGAGFPKYKSKQDNNKAYTTNCVNNNIRLADKHILLPKLGWVKVKLHRQVPVEYIIKSCTVSKSPTGRYHISILTEHDEIKSQPIVNTDNFIGLDMDMRALYTDSQGNRADYPRFYRQMQNKLAREQRKLSRCQKGGSNYHKQCLKVARLHEKVANQRKNFLHKLSRQLVSQFNGVCIEDLNMKAMGQGLNLGKSIADNGWGIFTNFLNYKLSDEGKPIIKIDKWFPSSKTCSNCDNINHELKLSDTKWTCTNCGTYHDRNENAAVNIKCEGIRIYETPA